MAERDYLEQNIERLFRSVEPEMKIPAPERDRLLRALMDEGAGLRRGPAQVKRTKFTFGKRALLVAAVIVILLILFMTVLLREGPAEPEEQAGTVGVAENVDESLQSNEEQIPLDEKSVQDEILQAEMKRVLDMGLAGDIPALISVLARGHFLSKVVAANYLGRIGDQSAIGPLERAGADWLGEDGENPFTIAIEQIRKRLGLNDEDKDDTDQDITSSEGDPNLLEKDDSPEQIMVGATAVEGYVYDESGNPQAGLTLYCGNLTEYIISGGSGFESVETTVTADDGFYRFEDLDDIMYVIRCADENVSEGVVRKAILPIQNKTRRLDLGTGRILSGWARLDGQLLPNTRLLLADPYDPYITAFACYTVTDGQGNYAFTGAPTGLYGVYAESTESASGWVKLGKVSVGPADVTNYNFDIEYVTVNAEIKSTDPNQPLDILDVYIEQKQPGDRIRIADAVWPAEVGQPYVIERLLAGPYEIAIDIAGGVSIRESIELSAEQAEQSIEINIPMLTSSVSGLLEGGYSEGLVLRSEDNNIKAAVEPDSNGVYFIEPLPVGRYIIEYSSLTSMAPLAEFSLEDQQARIVDIDTDRWAAEPKAFVYVYAVDSSGFPLIGATAKFQTGGLPEKEVTSRGAFFVVQPGSYVVQAEYPKAGYKQASLKVELEAGNLTQFYDRTQVVYVTLEAK